MSEPRCEFSDMLVSQCAHCRAGGKILPPPDVERPSQPARTPYGPLFFARHYGPCSGCETKIIPDDTIRADGTGGYLHEDCEL